MNPAASSPSPKFTKSEVRFEHPANGHDRCMDCVHYLSYQNACAIVRGHIAPGDWCSKFKERG